MFIQNYLVQINGGGGGVEVFIIFMIIVPVIPKSTIFGYP